MDFVNAVTGWGDFTLDDLMTVGERRLNMMRAFNAREGLDRKADKLPKKFYKALQGEGPTAGVTLTVEEMNRAQDSYYEMSGWDKATGNPTRATLKRLDLGWVFGGLAAVAAAPRGRAAAKKVGAKKKAAVKKRAVVKKVTKKKKSPAKRKK